MTTKNPYPQTDPRWTIWEKIDTTNSVIRAYTEDIERTQRKIMDAKNQLPLYQRALELLSDLSDENSKEKEI